MIQRTTANDPNDPKKQKVKTKQRTIYRYFMWEN